MAFCQSQMSHIVDFSNIESVKSSEFRKYYQFPLIMHLRSAYVSFLVAPDGGDGRVLRDTFLSTASGPNPNCDLSACNCHSDVLDNLTRICILYKF